MIIAEQYERRRLEKIASHSTGERILDLGFADHPNDGLRAREVVGLDLRKPLTRPPNYSECLIGDATDLKRVFPEKRFDTVISAELIEHLENPYQHLRSIHEVLAPTGRLVLSTPNPVGFPAVFFEWTRSRARFYAEDHRHYISPRWVERMLSHTGFAVRTVEAVGLWLPKGPILRCPVGAAYQVIYVAEPVS
jgi:SAM-dependent methyltransferase